MINHKYDKYVSPLTFSNGYTNTHLLLSLRPHNYQAFTSVSLLHGCHFKRCYIILATVFYTIFHLRLEHCVGGH